MNETFWLLEKCRDYQQKQQTNDYKQSGTMDKISLTIMYEFHTVEQFHTNLKNSK